MPTLMRISPALQRHKWWLLLAVVLVLNAIRYWPVRHAAPGFGAGGPPPGGPGGPGGGAFREPDAAMLAQIQAMPQEQRAAVEQRMREDKDFFASVQNLPETERREKVQQHFAENPPPFGPPGPPGPPPGGAGGGPGGPGGPGDGGAPHIPPPEVRRGMDQGLVNSMKNAGGQ